MCELWNTVQTEMESHSKQASLNASSKEIYSQPYCPVGQAEASDIRSAALFWQSSFKLISYYKHARHLLGRVKQDPKNLTQTAVMSISSMAGNIPQHWKVCPSQAKTLLWKSLVLLSQQTPPLSACTEKLQRSALQPCMCCCHQYAAACLDTSRKHCCPPTQHGRRTPCSSHRNETNNSQLLSV